MERQKSKCKKNGRDGREKQCRGEKVQKEGKLDKEGKAGRKEKTDPCVHVFFTYPATLVDNPAGESVLKVVERHLLDLSCYGRPHAGHVDSGLGQAEHPRDRLPAGVSANVV